MQVSDIARTEGHIAATRTAREKIKSVTPEQLKSAEAEWRTAHPGKAPGADDIRGQAYQTLYNQALNDSGLGTGGKTQRAIQAATAAIQGLAGSDLSAALAGGSTPYIAHAIGDSGLGDSEKVMAHAVVNAALAAAQGKNGKGVIATAAGAGAGELTGVLSRSIYGKTPEAMSETEKQTVSALATVASGLAGGLTGDSSANALAGAQAGKTTVENNALSSKDEKQRQDAKWSLPYLKDEKQKQQTEKLVSDLNTKSKAFDEKLNKACQGLSSAACQGMRQELVSMAKSYDEQLDGQYIGNMGTVYTEGKGQVDSLMWQYATADVKAEREANVNRIAENWGVSKETAANLYDGMAVVHTTAAIGGAVYGLKGVKEPSVSKGTTSVVESEKAALDRISQNTKDTANLNSKQNYSVLDQQAVKSNVEIDSNKINYIFGRVNSNKHNTDRSTQMEQSMYRLGIPLDNTGAKYLTDHLSKVPKTPGNIVKVYTDEFGKYEVRESLLFGPTGKATKLESSFEIMPSGDRRFITTIPKEGKK